MPQTIEAPSEEDLANIEAKRAWVRGHYDPKAQDQYLTVEGKLRLLDTILKSGWIEATEKLKLQCLGIAFGDAVAQELDLKWVAVEDEYGRDPALHLAGTSIILFPLTMISKRIERGEIVEVGVMFQGICERVREIVARERSRT
jgi:hypothetical protein